ncbi:MAG: peroxiredoxin [Pseudohongiellaceae bacterium]
MTCRLMLTVLLIATLTACATTVLETEATSPALLDARSLGMTQPLMGAAGAVITVVFSSTDCPIANALAPELERIHRDFEQAGSRMLLVHARSDLDASAAAAHAGQYGFSMPVLIDSELALARALGVVVTPEAVVLRFTERDRWTVVYQGRVNDLYVALGKRRAAATSHDLRRAIDAALANRPIDFEPVPAVGCVIEGL